jgi:hypothetical protein
MEESIVLPFAHAASSHTRLDKNFTALPVKPTSIVACFVSGELAPKSLCRVLPSDSFEEISVRQNRKSRKIAIML